MITNNRAERGMALAVTMLVIFLVVTGIGVSALLTSTSGRLTRSSRDLSSVRSAAEGAVEYGFGVWNKLLNTKFAPPTNTEMATNVGSGPSFNRVTYTADGALKVQLIDVYGAPTTSTAGALVMLPKFPGWNGSTVTYLVSAKMSASTMGNRPVVYGAQRLLTYSNVPLFQATAFFEHDLELFQTAAMQIDGLVHTNGTAYVSQSSPGTLVFGDSDNPTYLSYVDGYNDSVAPPKADTWSGYSSSKPLTPDFDAGGLSVQGNKVDRMEPIGGDIYSILNPPYDDNGSATGDKNPNDDSMRELIEPPTSTTSYPEPTPIKERRLYNKAGIVIHVQVTPVVSFGRVTKNTYTTTVTTQNGTTLTSTQKTALVNALSQTSTLTTFYDRRESSYVDVTTLNLSAANSTLNAASNFNNIIYIDQTYADGSIPSNDPQAIRLVGGSTLPTDGLTVASQNPVYIQGDFNTATVARDVNNRATTPSAAVYADAVTILSNSWSDSKSSYSLSSRKASNTTVNGAIVAGFMPSGWTDPVSKTTYGYSGGLNNFPRFLEDWSSRKFTYVGSMIELFRSEVATGQWDTGTIYVPPTRIWSFDSNFMTKPPPGSLTAVTIARSHFMRY
jgi:hypothetical protein